MQSHTALSFALFLALGLSSTPVHGYAIEVTSGTLNVRASVMGTVLGQVAQGDRFVVSTSQGSWLRIDWRGRSAWISGDYVRRVQAAAVEVAVDLLNVRAGPSTSDSVIGVVARGQRYVQVDASGDWRLIQFDGRRGYVAGWHVTGVDLGQSPGAAAQPPASSGQSQNAPMSATAAELEVMARIVKGEAGVAPYEGKVAVAAVILNRVRHPWFPDTIIGVAHQPYQFSAYNANVRDQLYWGPIPQSAWQAARDALNGADPSLGATYYFNPYLVRPSWAQSLIFTRRIGTRPGDTHDFYKTR